MVRFVVAFLLALSVTGYAGAREVVDRPEGEFERGAIVVDTSERALYYIVGRGKAVKYSVAVGSPKNQWFGKTHVAFKREDPVWRPTASQRRKNPKLPRVVKPGPKNPLGPRALYLGWSAYRIHGTIAPNSIGRAVSNGCIRMHNEDVKDLYARIHIGAPVYVVR